MRTKQLIYLIVVLIIPIGFWAVSTLPFQTDVSTYNLASDQSLAAYGKFVEELGREENDSSTIIVLEKASLWKTQEDFQTLDRITRFWEAEDGISTVSSLSNLRYPRFATLQHHEEPFLDLENELQFQKRMETLELYPDIFEKFLSQDQRFTLLFLSVGKGIPKSSVAEFEEKDFLKNDIQAHYIQYDLIEEALQNTIRRDSFLLAIISLILVLSGFYLFTHSLSGLGLIGLMVSFNISMTFLMMFLLGMEYTMHMITIPAIITVLSFTDIMHILYHQQKAQSSSSGQELRKKILENVKTPLLLTSLTNLAGFLVFLVFANNRHLFNFSLTAMIGVVVAYLSSRFLVIQLMDKDFLFIRRQNFGGLYQLHSRISNRLWKAKKVVMSGFLIVSALLLLLVVKHFSLDGTEGEFQLSDSSLTEGAEILQQEFFGSKQAEVFITIREGNIWDQNVLKSIEQVEGAVDSLFKPFYINSPLVLVKRYHRYLRNGNPKAYFVPNRMDSAYMAQLNENQEQLGAKGILDASGKRAGIVFGYGSEALPQTRKLYGQLQEVLLSQSDNNVMFELSGLQYLSDEATWRFSYRILLGLVLSILFGSLLVWVFLGSLRKSLGVLLVNLFPMLFSLGLMLYFEIPISPLTLFFLSILLGVCVDDSIYLIAQSRKPQEALHVVPVFITSVVLSIGFFSLAFSSFEWMRPFGWIFLGGISTAYILDLFILPVFLSRKAIFGTDE